MDNKEKLFLENKYIVELLVKRVCYIKSQYDDLLQVGYLALLKAIDKYDPNREVKLSSFATKYILGSLYKEMQKLSKEIILNQTEQEMINNIPDNYNTNNNFISISLNKLEKSEKSVILLKIYYNTTNKEIAKKFKISESMVNKIYQKGILKMKKYL